MSKSVPAWRITRIRGNRADRLAIIRAPNADAAIKAAIQKLKITDRETVKRLAAFRDE